jgi:hypothetical protein
VYETVRETVRKAVRMTATPGITFLHPSLTFILNPATVLASVHYTNEENTRS